MEDCRHYSIGLAGYHIMNSDAYLNISMPELTASGKSKMVTTSIPGVVEEYLRNHQNAGSKVDGWLVYV